MDSSHNHLTQDSTLFHQYSATGQGTGCQTLVLLESVQTARSGMTVDCHLSVCSVNKINCHYSHISITDYSYIFPDIVPGPKWDISLWMWCCSLKEGGEGFTIIILIIHRPARRLWMFLVQLTTRVYIADVALSQTVQTLSVQQTIKDCTRSTRAASTDLNWVWITWML